MHDTHSISDMSLNVTPSSVTTSLQTREEVTAQPSPTSESMLTVAAFGEMAGRMGHERVGTLPQD